MSEERQEINKYGQPSTTGICNVTGNGNLIDTKRNPWLLTLRLPD